MDVPWPFLGTEALAAGLATNHGLRTRYVAVHRNVYAPRGVELTALDRATAAYLWSGRRAVVAVLDGHRGARGVIQLRRALALADAGAESPQETRTRLLLVSVGLPRPHTQIEVRDEFGCFVARLDMGWSDHRVAVEFDGAQHWTDARQRTRDIDRLAELDALGWIVIRVSSDMLRERRSAIVRRVRTALAERGLVVDESASGRRELDARARAQASSSRATALTTSETRRAVLRSG